MLAELHPSRKRPNPFFQDFNVPYDPDVPVSYLFGLVSKQRHWKPWSRTWKRNWNRCMQLEYERLIGCCNKNLDTWQDLCRLVGIDGTFLSIRQRKKVCPGVLS
jgi:hypothetical protein